MFYTIMATSSRIHIKSSLIVISYIEKQVVKINTMLHSNIVVK